MGWSCRIFLLIFVVHLSFNPLRAADLSPPFSENSVFSYVHSKLNVRDKRSSVPLPSASLPAAPQNPPVNTRDCDSSELIVEETAVVCNHISNALVQQHRDTLYLLIGNQLFLLDVQEAKKDIQPVVTFEQFTENATQFSVHPWTAADETELVVAIAFHTHYNVYRFSTRDKDGESTAFNRKQIVRQKIAIVDGRSIKVRLFMNEGDLYLLLADNNSNGRSSVS